MHLPDGSQWRHVDPTLGERTLIPWDALPRWILVIFTSVTLVTMLKGEERMITLTKKTMTMIAGLQVRIPRRDLTIAQVKTHALQPRKRMANHIKVEEFAGSLAGERAAQGWSADSSFSWL